jgi:type 1 glutamine amidotransferase
VTRTLIVSGGGRYADPWHPFPETSQEIAALLSDEGHQVTIAADPDSAFESLVNKSQRPDLLVVNIGNPEGGVPTSGAAGGLRTYLNAGHPLLALHSSATAFSAWPDWERMLGGRWVRGTSMHPDQSLCRVHLSPHDHPIIQGQSDFQVFDERYSFLRTQEITPLAHHIYDGNQHSLLWIHRFGSAKVVYDALGHDARSYRSSGHRSLLRRSVAWLLESSPAGS